MNFSKAASGANDKRYEKPCVKSVKDNFITSLQSRCQFVRNTVFGTLIVLSTIAAHIHVSETVTRNWFHRGVLDIAKTNVTYRWLAFFAHTNIHSRARQSARERQILQIVRIVIVKREDPDTHTHARTSREEKTTNPRPIQPHQRPTAAVAGYNNNNKNDQ